MTSSPPIEKAADRRSRRLKKPPIEIGGWHSRSMLKQAGADA
jgi:hypothetical protein